MKPLYVALILALIAIVGAGSWLAAWRGSKPQASTAASRFFDTPQHYDTKGGQPMKPRWNE